jgi:hypothetical protein
MTKAIPSHGISSSGLRLPEGQTKCGASDDKYSTVESRKETEAEEESPPNASPETIDQKSDSRAHMTPSDLQYHEDDRIGLPIRQRGTLQGAS